MNAETPITESPGLGHNAPPVVLPKEADLLADIKRRYPEIEKDLSTFEASFATYNGPDGRPITLELKDKDVAAALSDLIDDAKKSRRTWKAHGTSEKGPLNKLVKVVTNFFTGADEKIEGLISTYAPALEDYLKKVEDDKARKREEEIERQRLAAEAARLAKEAEEKKAAEAAAAAEAERRREAEARAAAERAEAEKKEQERLAAEAAERARALEAERREKERAEKERNAAGIRDAKANLKAAENFDRLAEAEESTDDELASLENYIKPRGVISTIMTPVATSPLLDAEQVQAVADIQNRLQTLRANHEGRVSKRQQRAIQKAAEEEAARQAALAAQRKADKEAEDKRLADEKAARAAAEAEQARLAEERRKATEEARAAREAARGHERTAKQADREAGKAEDTADRAANRADRLEGRAEDRANVRGDLGSNSGLTRRWRHYVDDEAAIRATLGPLGPHIGLDAIEAAAFHWMRAHQDGFEGERVTPAELPGVRFALEEDLTTR